MAELSTKAVGSTVNLYMDGVARAFRVVHQGLPSSIYDASCNGTWLMLVDSYDNITWDSSNNDYANSDIHAFLNGTFLSMFPGDIQRTIQTVRIPYWNGTGSGGSLATGSNGLQCKVFLPAHNEMKSGTSSSIPADGSQLAYFAGIDFSDYATYKEYQTWLRSPCTSDADTAWYLHGHGSAYNVKTVVEPILPIIIMPGRCEVDSGGNVQPSVSVKGNANIGGAEKALTKAYACIGDSWKEVTDAYVKISGEWKPIV